MQDDFSARDRVMANADNPFVVGVQGVPKPGKRVRILPGG